MFTDIWRLKCHQFRDTIQAVIKDTKHIIAK